MKPRCGGARIVALEPLGAFLNHLLVLWVDVVVVVVSDRDRRRLRRLADVRGAPLRVERGAGVETGRRARLAVDPARGGALVVLDDAGADVHLAEDAELAAGALERVGQGALQALRCRQLRAARFVVVFQAAGVQRATRTGRRRQTLVVVPGAHLVDAAAREHRRARRHALRRGGVSAHKVRADARQLAQVGHLHPLAHRRGGVQHAPVHRVAHQEQDVRWLLGTRSRVGRRRQQHEEEAEHAHHPPWPRA